MGGARKGRERIEALVSYRRCSSFFAVLYLHADGGSHGRGTARLD